MILAEEEFSSLIQKPSLEKVEYSFGRSLSFMRFNDSEPNSEPLWHYHPEIELVYVDRGNGKRHIGNHISYYTSGDLIMIGSNVPHYGFTDRFTSRNRENVIQFHPDVFQNLTLDLPELSKISEIINRSQHGVSFHGATKEKVGRITDSMAIQGDFEQLLSLIRILNILTLSEEYNLLNASKVTVKSSLQDHVRIKVVFNYVMERFQVDITLKEVSALTNMTIPSFCRFFKKQTAKTFTQFVNEVRITHACKLLSETSRAISDICFECGFNNFAHFNNQFKKVTSQNPTEYRASFKQVLSM